MHWVWKKDTFLYYKLILTLRNRKKQAKKFHPDLSKSRPVVFYDTDIKRIDWEKNKIAVIKRIFERENGEEIKEIILFYGKETISSTLKNYLDLTAISIDNIRKYLN